MIAAHAHVFDACARRQAFADANSIAFELGQHEHGHAVPRREHEGDLSADRQVQEVDRVGRTQRRRQLQRVGHVSPRILKLHRLTQTKAAASHWLRRLGDLRDLHSTQTESLGDRLARGGPQRQDAGHEQGNRQDRRQRSQRPRPDRATRRTSQKARPDASRQVRRRRILHVLTQVSQRSLEVGVQALSHRPPCCAPRAHAATVRVPARAATSRSRAHSPAPRPSRLRTVRERSDTQRLADPRRGDSH